MLFIDLVDSLCYFNCYVYSNLSFKTQHTSSLFKPWLDVNAKLDDNKEKHKLQINVYFTRSVWLVRVKESEHSIDIKRASVWFACVRSGDSLTETLGPS